MKTFHYIKLRFENISFTQILDLEGGKFFFNTVREGDSVLFATEDEQVLASNPLTS